MPRGVYARPPAHPSPKILIVLPPEVLKRLNEYAQRKGMSRCSVVRGAINRLLLSETANTRDTGAPPTPGS